MTARAITRLPRGLLFGGREGVSTSYAEAVLRASFDPTSATQILLGTLPIGARVLDVRSWGGATGGTNPTVDIGTVADDDGFGAELDADGNSGGFAAGTLGVLANTSLTVPTRVYGKVGASAATGGTTTVTIHFIVESV